MQVFPVKMERTMKRAIGRVLLGLLACCVTTALYADRGEILNPEAPIKINTAGFGIAISGFKLNIDSQKLSGATFTIRNDSRKPLVAYVVSVDFCWNTSPQKPFHTALSEDSWFLNSPPIEPGTEEQEQLRVSVIPHEVMHLLRVAVNLEYAEFSDGSVVGVSAQTLKAKFDEARRAKLDVQQYYANMINAGISPHVIANRIETDLRNNKYTGSQRTALIQIETQLSKLGPDDLAKKLVEAPSVPLGPAAPLN